MTQATPLRLVVNFTGGAIHAVYCGQPVEVIFLSYDDDDIDDHQTDLGYRSMDNDPVALWHQANTDLGDDADVSHTDIVEHYFNEYALANPA